MFLVFIGSLLLIGWGLKSGLDWLHFPSHPHGDEQIGKSEAFEGLFLSTAFGLWGAGWIISEWRKHRALEEKWLKMLKDNRVTVEYILCHPEGYQKDFVEWVKKNYRNLATTAPVVPPPNSSN